jgi:hypothetical protein
MTGGTSDGQVYPRNGPFGFNGGFSFACALREVPVSCHRTGREG